MQGDWIIDHHAKDTHLIPNADLIEHQPDADCICGPTHRSDVSSGELRWNVRHHSLDGRERDE